MKNGGKNLFHFKIQCHISLESHNVWPTTSFQVVRDKIISTMIITLYSEPVAVEDFDVSRVNATHNLQLVEMIRVPFLHKLADIGGGEACDYE